MGESGCGKSMTALSLMRLIPDPPGRIVSGSVKLGGRDLLQISEEEMRRVRGNEISMIFQEPMTSLNPVMTIGKQIAEALILHRDMDRKAAFKRAIEMLDLVRIPEPAQRAKEYPHQLSGGMRQRAMIAMALACNPKVLIADEPTTALDVTIQAQILELIVELQREFSAAVILITHDLGVVAETARRVIVMYAGRKVEEAEVGELFARPLHPYTVGLLASIPRLDLMRGQAVRNTGRLQEIPGIVPPLFDLPEGCAFAPRCNKADDLCRRERPTYEQKRDRPLGGLLALRCVGSGTRSAHEPRRQHACARGQGPQEALPGAQGPAAPHRRPGLCRRRHQLLDRRRRDAGPGGRERLRQDHRRPRRAAPDRADLRLGAGRRHRDHRPVQVGDAALPGADADHLPGPVLLAQSAHDGGRDRGRAAAGARHRQPQGARRAGRGPVRPRRASGRRR